MTPDVNTATDQSQSETPDDVGIPLGFTPASNSDRIRTRLGSWALISASLRIGSVQALRRNASATRRSERRWARWIARAARMHISVSGADQIDPRQQYLVMPLHESFVDVPTLLHLPLDMRFLVRDELFDLPNFGPYLTASRQIPVAEPPTVANLRAIYSGVESAIDAGESVVVFPQGSILGVEVAFRRGAVRLARRFGLPILPIAISGTHRVWEYPYTQTVRLDQHVEMSVLAPIEPTDVSLSQLRIAEREMKARALASKHAPVRRFEPTRDGWWDDYAFEIDEDFPDLGARVTERRAQRSGTPGLSA